jgi:transcription initiation factor TFIID subunit TAF12
MTIYLDPAPPNIATTYWFDQLAMVRGLRAKGKLKQQERQRQRQQQRQERLEKRQRQQQQQQQQQQQGPATRAYRLSSQAAVESPPARKVRTAAASPRAAPGVSVRPKRRAAEAARLIFIALAAHSSRLKNCRNVAKFAAAVVGSRVAALSQARGVGRSML